MDPTGLLPLQWTAQLEKHSDAHKVRYIIKINIRFDWLKKNCHTIMVHNSQAAYIFLQEQRRIFGYLRLNSIHPTCYWWHILFQNTFRVNGASGWIEKDYCYSEKQCWRGQNGFELWLYHHVFIVGRYNLKTTIYPDNVILFGWRHSEKLLPLR